MSYGTLTTTLEGGVATITLASADGMNCYTPEMGEDLVSALRGAAADRAVRAIVLTGAGRAFCAGAHRDALRGVAGPSGFRIGEEAFIRSFAPEFAAIPKLVVAAMNGSAAGIGVTMALLCDLRIVAAGAKLRLNFAELGIVPGLGSTRTLVALVGVARAKKLLLAEPLVSAEQALSFGLVDEVVAPEQLMARARALTRIATEAMPGVVAEIKACLDPGDVRAAIEREARATDRLRGTPPGGEP